MPYAYISEKDRIHFNLAKIKKGGEKFEIDIDPEKAMAFRNGELKEIRDVLKAEHIFSDTKKGMLASEKEMQKWFNTSDPLEVAKIILKEGEIQVNEEYREKLREDKRKKLIHLIQRNGVDPKTHLPHPETRIVNAFEEAKVKIDEYKPAEQQVNDVLKKLRVVLPIKFEIKEISVRIPAEYAVKSYGAVKGYGRMLKEEWLNDGSWSVVVEIPGGLETDFYEKLNKLTHGNNEIKVIKMK